MDFTPTPAALVFGQGFHADQVAQQSWTVDWSPIADREGLYHRLIASEIDFRTSGSTGVPQLWRRRREALWHEAGLLADLLGDHGPDSVVSFAPSVHLFGALGGVIMPARLGIPVWYRPSYVGALPAISDRRVAVIATPWIFHLLANNLDWVRAQRHVTILYGGAMLPPTADRLLQVAGPDLMTIVEVLGSTEAGGTAWRRWSEGEPPAWTLFADVDFATNPESCPTSGRAENIALHIQSPRLAARPGEAAPTVWRSDDIVTITGPRSFELLGRSGRLVKVNGRRINLDEAENALRSVIVCEDLALVPILDEAVGEHIELQVKSAPGTTVGATELRLAFDRLPVRPKRVRRVDMIRRSELGKRVADGVQAGEVAR